LGAPGAGVPTLGRALGATLGLPYFDSDDYFWLSTEPPFTQRGQPRAAALRRRCRGRPRPSGAHGGLSGLGGWLRRQQHRGQPHPGQSHRLARALYLPGARIARWPNRGRARGGSAGRSANFI